MAQTGSANSIKHHIHTMFTGIISDIGTIKTITTNGERRFTIATHYDTSSIALGASIACNGACLTVVERKDDWFAVEASAETLRLTTLAQWQTGTRINLERAAKLGDELGGHLVTGHVDGMAELVSLHEEGGSRVMDLAAPEPLKIYIAAKGSITLDGVSLTVNTVEDNHFRVNIIPHTLQHTTLQDRIIGDRLNIEIDIIARYIARMQKVD